MAELAELHTSQFERIKTNIDNSWQNFEHNINRFNDFKRFVFVTSLSENEKSALHYLKKPEVEFNILEAFISRLIGEFSKSEPSIRIMPNDVHKVDEQTINVIEGHVRYCLQESNKNGMQYNIYRDTLAGGFSSIKIYTEYSGEMSFHQDICMKKTYDPTLTGFDPLACTPSKGDGDYCFELFPMRLEDFKREFPDVDVNVKQSGAYDSTTNIGPFKASIKTGKDAIILVADYYEKKKVKRKIVMLADGSVKTEKEYKKFLMEWEASGQIAQPPAVVGKPRKTEITEIVRYRVIENKIIDFEETDFKQLPIIFVDGNSILAKESNIGPVNQVTRPYVYQAKGAQRLKNLAGQQLCSEIEDIGPPKTVVSLEAIPKDYLDSYLDPQSTIVKIYNAFYNGDPSIPLQAPSMEPRPQIPAEITNAFVGADALVQNILGAFDGSLAKLTENEVSGIAIQESATLSNAAAMPYIVNNLKGLEAACQCFVNLLPLYYTTPRTIPVISKDGKKSYVAINQEGGVKFDYDHDALSVTIEAGPSFSVQKARALQQIIALMQASPSIADVINRVGPHLLIDNVEMRNVETLKELIEQDMQAKAQAPQQPSPEQQAIQVAQMQVQMENQAAMAKIQQTAAAEQIKAQLKLEEFELEKQRLLMDLAKIKGDYELGLAKLGISQQEANAKDMSALIDASIKASEHHNSVADKEFDKAMKVMEHVAENMQNMEEVNEINRPGEPINE